MDDKLKQLAVDLLKAWAAAKGPDADHPVSIVSGRTYSANDYVTEVENDTQFGKDFLESMKEAAKRTKTPVDQYMKQNIR